MCGRFTLSSDKKIKIYFPNIKLCTDNAGMIAMAGYKKILNGHHSDYNLEVNPNLSLQ